MNSRIRLCINVEDRHDDVIKYVMEQTGTGRSELLRRVMDFSLQPGILNQIIPSMSGQIKTER